MLAHTRRGTHCLPSQRGLLQLASRLQVSVFDSCKIGRMVMSTPTQQIAARLQGGCLTKMMDAGMKNEREHVTLLGDMHILKSRSVSYWRSEEEELRSRGLVLASFGRSIAGSPGQHRFWPHTQGCVEQRYS